MTEVISVRFKNKGKIYFFDPAGVEVQKGDNVIVETAKGLEYAECVKGKHVVEDSAVRAPLRPVIRVATKEDIAKAEENRRREAEAFEICRQKIEKHGLDMKLVDVEYNFEGNKILFFFTSDGRVDFRELVKDLAAIFKTRIELRQIGVRDEARMLGGLGICGKPFCCVQFLDDFEPVSIKMAKTQGLSLNPTKISGTCGRLMCCLKYEQDAYEDLVKDVPKVDSFVETPAGKGSVVDVNLLKSTVRVRLEDQSETSIRTFKASEITTLGGKAKRAEYLALKAEGKIQDTKSVPHLKKSETAVSKKPLTDYDHNSAANDEEVSDIDDLAVEQTGKETSDTPPAVHKSRKHQNRRRRSNAKKPSEHTSSKSAEQASHHLEPQVKQTEQSSAAKTPDNSTPDGTAPARKRNNYHRRYHHGKKRTGTAGTANDGGQNHGE